MDKETNYNELESKNVSNQASTDNLSNDNTPPINYSKWGKSR